MQEDNLALLKNPKIDLAALYYLYNEHELLKLQQEFPIVDPSFSTAFSSSPTHYVGTSLFERKPAAIVEGTEVFITKAWKFPLEAQVVSTATQALYNENFALDLLYSFSQNADNFELETIIKFKKFESITDIYIEEGEQFINIRIFLDLERYDYNLMNDIFNDAEFPLRDKFERNKLFNFQYTYKAVAQYESIEYFGERIFHRL